MSDWNHPSEEQLSAYFDNELSAAEREQVEAAIENSPEAQAFLTDLAAMADMGPAIDDRMPNESYWQDLPDRVLARIANEDATEAVRDRVIVDEPAKSGSWWQRLLGAQSGRWAAATAVMGILALGLYWQNQNPIQPGNFTADGTPSDEAPSDIFQNPAVTPVSQPDLASGGTSDFQQRVFDTIREDRRVAFGTGLGLVDGTSTQSRRLISSPLHDVGLDQVDANFQEQTHRQITNPAVPETPEGHLAAALIMEKQGYYNVARQGYDLVVSETPHGNDFHLAAEAGLKRIEYRALMEQHGARNMLGVMQAAYLTNVNKHRSNNHQDCDQAWKLLVSFIDLAKEKVPAADMQQAKADLQEIMVCVER
ncbi:MAG: hypothetical protein HKN21_07860 [Candidatus Eisenbacteria bacterium]|uniref:Putative zinc-finger domain-containing protein n=1 Tax=Eiseniibacteriota bacterium TaxID=2212470 RepID=A0A7Y2EB13_UNCEI|nr:hypothetical protein [Candidatus Eisenbacteria bacterium]